jgi:uncharacterized protein YyaL (SSP411 family)
VLDPEGGFYSTQDADSDGEEGKFFVRTPAEIREVLGDQAQGFMAAYGVTPGGNFEGKNILEFVGDMNQRASLTEARRKLYEVREKRVHPGRDERVLTSWNELMLAAFAEVARALERDDGSRALAASYRRVAERNAEFLLRELRQDTAKQYCRRRVQHCRCPTVAGQRTREWARRSLRVPQFRLPGPSRRSTGTEGALEAWKL